MYEHVPNELKLFNNWVCWKFETEANGRISKKPINPVTGGYAMSNNSKTWSSYDTALKSSKKFDGIGFMFSESPFFGIDLDNMNGDIEDYRAGDTDNVIAEFIHTLQSYAEYSVSGNGIHVIGKGKLPEGGRRKGSFEFYEEGRFFTVTGNLASDFTDVIDCTDTVKALHEKYIGGIVPTTGISITLPLNLSESEIIKLAEGSKQGTSFSALYNGQWDSLYTSRSEADMAFCNMLAFWTGKDEQQMDKIFRGSGLMREKWDRRQSKSTYGAITLRKAIRTCQNVYEPAPEYSVTIGSAVLADGKVKKIYSFDDTGNSERFTDLFGEKVRYNFTSKSWMYYDGRKWSDDLDGSVKRMGDETVELMRHDLEYYVSNLPEDMDAEDMEKAFMKHLKSSRSNKNKVAMLKQSEHNLPILPSQMDTQKMLLCAPNGVMNLVTSELLPHDPSLYITKITNCEYTDKTDYPLWEKFLKEIFDNDLELIKFMQKAIGYSMTGSNKEQCAFFCYGTGQNGKSTFLETISDILGDYATNIQPETIMLKQATGGPSGDIARLKGARFVNSAEPNQGVKLNESLVKQMTGGDKLTARKLYGNEFEFTSEFKLWMSTNYKPVIKGTDKGIWRRIRLIPFTVTIPDDKIDRNLKYKLRQEMPGIFKWMVEGCLLWQREGLKIPSAIANATKEYKDEMDVISSFLEECCEEGNGEEVDKDLYQAFIVWAKETNEFEMSSRKFNTEMLKRFDRRKSNGQRIYTKVTLLDGYIPTVGVTFAPHVQRYNKY